MKIIYSKITGTGKYVPKMTLKNDDLKAFVDTSDEWIYQRTGISERHIADKDSCDQLGIKASLQAIKSAGIDPGEIELIIVATMSSEFSTPATACLVQKAIGADKAMAFDLNAACSGFVFGLHTANEFIQNGTFKNALVVGAEKMSHLVNWKDRNTCVLFGDGAGAVIIEASEEKGIMAIESKSIGKDYDCLVSKIKRIQTPFYEVEDADYIQMDGRPVFEFACKTVPRSLKRIFDKVDISPDDVEVYVMHQANIRILQVIAKKLKQDMNKFVVNLNHYGNTSAASVPIALDEAYKSGKLEGKLVALAGFGGGLTYGSAVIQF